MYGDIVDQELKTFFKRTWCIQLGMILPQILFYFTLKDYDIVHTILSLLFVEAIVLAIYVFIFGVKQKDGTLTRNKYVSNFMKPHEDFRNLIDRIKKDQGEL